MKKSLLVLLSVFLIVAVASAQNFAAKKEVLKIAEPQKEVIQGERLVYQLHWLGVPIGRIILGTVGTEEVSGKPCYHISASAQPNKFFSRFYDFEYVVHSYIDKDTLQTLRFEKTRRVKGKTSKVTINFDREKQRAELVSEGQAPSVHLSPVRSEIGKTVADSEKTLSGAQDLFSSLFQLRHMQLSEGKEYSIPVYYGKKNWMMQVAIGKPYRKDLRRAGSFVLFDAVIDSKLGAFILGKNRIVMTMTADERRVPVGFVFGIGLGSVHGNIQTGL